MAFPPEWKLPDHGKLYQAPVETTGAGNPLAGSDQALLLAITMLLHETVPYPDAATRDATHAQLAASHRSRAAPAIRPAPR